MHKKKQKKNGIFRLQYADELFWGKKEDNAAYLHSFTTKRTLAGKSLGYKILKAIETKLIPQKVEFFRLDCGKNIEALCNYYKNYGFKEIDEVEIEGKPLILFEKKIFRN